MPDLTKMPCDYEFHILADSYQTIMSKAYVQAIDFFGETEFQIRVNVHRAGHHQDQPYNAHVTAMKVIQYDRGDY